MPIASALAEGLQSGGRTPALAVVHPDTEPTLPNRPALGYGARPGANLIEKNDFSIRIVDGTDPHAVEKLVSRMYRRRGYGIPDPGAREQASTGSSVTLEARQGQHTVGTLTVNLGGSRGLNAESLYAEEIAPYRRPGVRIAEFNRLAMNTVEAGRETLAALFHVGVLFAFRIFGARHLFIEVNPRHAMFYRVKLGFELLGEERTCPRVNAPAVLLHKDLAVCAAEAARFGGHREPGNKSFYAFFLAPAEERIVADNLRMPLRLAS
jgi:hypothetical protein